MSVARQMMANSWGQDIATNGDLLSLATTENSGISFRGIISPKEMIDPETGFRDPREFADLEVSRDQLIADGAGILLDPTANFPEMRITGAGTWSITGREDNPTDHAVKFVLQKIVAGLDT